MLAYKLRSLKTLQWPAQGINQKVATTLSVRHNHWVGLVVASEHACLGLLLLLLLASSEWSSVSQGGRDMGCASAAAPPPPRGGGLSDRSGCPPALPVHASVGIIL